jgi:NUMOD4 motif
MTKTKDLCVTSIKDLPGEVWKPVLNFEEVYHVSNLGRIKSLDRYKEYYQTNGTSTTAVCGEISFMSI